MKIEEKIKFIIIWLHNNNKLVNYFVRKHFAAQNFLSIL